MKSDQDLWDEAGDLAFRISFAFEHDKMNLLPKQMVGNLARIIKRLYIDHGAAFDPRTLEQIDQDLRQGKAHPQVKRSKP